MPPKRPGVAAIIPTPMASQPAVLASIAPSPPVRTGKNDRGASARSARKKLVAGYLARWRAQVEQAGTSHYPGRTLAHARRHRLTVEVVIDAQGHVRSSRIVRSSGSTQLDRAALRILRLAAPFPPFPPALRKRHRELRFAYTWRFVGAKGGHSLSHN